MKKNVIIINHDPLLKRINQIFCIEEMRQAGLSVVYLDFSRFLYPNIFIIDELNSDIVEKIHVLDDFYRIIKTFSPIDTVVITELSFSWKTKCVYKYLSRHHFFLLKISLYANNSLSNSIVDKLQALNFSKIIESVRLRMFLFLTNTHIIDLHLTSNASVKNRIPIHHPDFELYYKTLQSVNEQKCIVFLDEYFPLHPEIVYWFKKKFDFSDSYQRKMRLLFDELERKYNLPVLIAAHPKSDYNGTEFGNRQIIKGETAELLRNAFGVILHCSSSISYAILNDVNVLLVTTKEYEKSPKYMIRFQKSLARFFKMKIWYIDSIKETPDFQKVDSNIREKYICRFLTSNEIVGVSNHEIIIKTINEIIK